jgi:hypothetical protein
MSSKETELLKNFKGVNKKASVINTCNILEKTYTLLVEAKGQVYYSVNRGKEQWSLVPGFNFAWAVIIPHPHVSYLTVLIKIRH